MRELSLPKDYPWKIVSTVVSDRDVMLVPNGERHYLSVGISAAQNSFAAIEARGLDAVSGILDMPCGHSRVTRVLRAAALQAKALSLRSRRGRRCILREVFRC